MSEPQAEVPASGRNTLRGKIFKSVPVRKKLITFNGVEIELRQPKLGDILDAQSETDRTRGVIDTLIKHAYVPGTDERVFEEADTETLRNMPFGQDFIGVNTALEELTEVNFLERR